MDSSLIRVFVSHAGPDHEIARRLADDLGTGGNHITVDVNGLRPGDDVIQFMNEGIENSDFVLILYSKHSKNAVNQIVEMNSAIWNQINQCGGKCIVVRLDETPLPPLLGVKIYISIKEGDENSYSRAVAEIAETISISGHPTQTINKALSVDGGNPFRRIRAEYFEEDRDLLARTFAPPDQRRLSQLEDRHPCVLEGPRGTGKSMLLMSLRARNYLRGHDDLQERRIFGFYLKLARGALTNVLDILQCDDASEAALKETSAQEMFVCIIESLLSELRFCADKNLVDVTQNDMKILCREIGNLFNLGDTTDSLGDILTELSSLRRDIAAYLRKRFVYLQHSDIPTVAFDQDLVAETIRRVKTYAHVLKNHDFVILLDEYENLHEFQQIIINGLAKTASPRFSIKIARKRSVGYPSSTPSGQTLEETHDYSTIDLVYNLSDRRQKSAYMELLGRFVENIVRSELNHSVTLDSLLPSFDTDEVECEIKLKEVAALCKISYQDFENWPLNKRREKLNYYGIAATYRSLARGKKKRFATPSDLALVSSGVIRYFQEILAVGYYLAASDSDFSTGDSPVIPPDVQNRAVYLVSEHNLTSLSRNIDGKGDALRYFMLDIGGCLRHKLLKHRSEPESARIWLRDPEHLADASMSDLRDLLDAGVREGVLELPGGMPGYFPRHASESQGFEYLICRIFAPVLNISPRARWRTETTCEELRLLLDRGDRLQAVRKIKARWVRDHDDRQEQLI